MFNVAIFAIACAFLYMLKQYPNYKVAIACIFIGVLLVNLHSWLRWRWYKNSLKLQELSNFLPIVPKTCPDFWQKETDKKGVVTCKNNYNENNENDEETAKYYVVGGDKLLSAGYPTNKSMDKSFPLGNFTSPSIQNQFKCSNISQMPTPWVEMQTKCSAAKL
jgi:hypothetical protein